MTDTKELKSLFDGVPPSDDLTLEDHAFLCGITVEMVDQVVEASMDAAFRSQVRRYLGESFRFPDEVKE